MKTWALVPAVLFLAACENGLAIPDFRDEPEAAAPTLQLSDKERLTAAIAANGCTISPVNVGPVLQQASVAASQSSGLLLEMVNEGTLFEDGADTLRLAPALCI